MNSSRQISKRLQGKARFIPTSSNLVASFDNIYDLEELELKLDDMKCKYITTYVQECIKVGSKKSGDLVIVKKYNLHSRDFFKVDK